MSDFRLRANKSFMRDLSKTDYSPPTTEMIKKLRTELNNDEIDLSKLHRFKIKSSKPLSLKFKKEDFVLPTIFPWTTIKYYYLILTQQTI